MVHAIKRWRPYLLDAEFIVETDHAALLALSSKELPTSRLVRWALELQAFKYVIKHIKGSAHLAPDALTRLPYDDVTNPSHARDTATCRPARDPDGDDDADECPRGSLDNTYASEQPFACYNTEESPRCMPCPAGREDPDVCTSLRCSGEAKPLYCVKPLWLFPLAVYAP